jgi:hypothetical protein
MKRAKITQGSKADWRHWPDIRFDHHDITNRTSIKHAAIARPIRSRTNHIEPRTPGSLPELIEVRRANDL